MILDLPREILYQVIEEFTDPQTLVDFSLCNRQLSQVVHHGGWKVFVKANFPYKYPFIPTDVDYWQVAKSFFLFSKAWDEKEMVRRDVLSRGNIFISSGSRMFRDSIPKRQMKYRRGQQTIGCQPRIDSIEVVVNDHWGLRQEFLAFSTGAGLFIRSKLWDRNLKDLDSVMNLPRDLRYGYYHPKGLEDGWNDITTLKLINCSNMNASVCNFEILLGRASGELSIIKLILENRSSSTSPAESLKPITQRSFNVSGPVRTSSISPSSSIATAVLENGKMEMFRNLEEDSTDAFFSETIANDLWATSFLSETSMAVGCGPDSSPLRIYQLRPTGLENVPVREYRQQARGTVKSICPLPETFRYSHPAVFLSGHNDGTVRLHDNRSHKLFESIYGDLHDVSQIFSIITKGRDQVIAGNAERGLMQCFDLQKPGKHYHAGSQYVDSHPFTSELKLGWSFFIGESHPKTSPIYSLSSPSAFSPTIYVGTEGEIQQIEFMNPFGKHHDLAYNAKVPIVEPWEYWDRGNVKSNSKRTTGVTYFDHHEPNKLKNQWNVNGWR